MNRISLVCGLTVFLFTACAEMRPVSHQKSVPVDIAKTVTLKGKLFYRPAHGGYLALETAEGVEYDLHGEPARHLKAMLGKEGDGAVIFLTGYILENMRCRHKAGPIFQVMEYKW